MKTQDEELQEIIFEIDKSSPQQLTATCKNQTFELQIEPFLTQNLSG